MAPENGRREGRRGEEKRVRGWWEERERVRGLVGGVACFKMMRGVSCVGFSCPQHASKNSISLAIV
jgi:hypothetical protein